jgi:hypothetical protein
MKEVTMVTTCEITVIVKVTDDGVSIIEMNKETIEGQVKQLIKSDLQADNVKILKNQIFIRDIQTVNSSSGNGQGGVQGKNSP